EQAREPDSTGMLSGMSGGPQLDRTGAVEGVTVAHSARTGKIVTTPVSRVREVVPGTVPHVRIGGGSIHADNYGSIGRGVRDSGAVSLVFCSSSGFTAPRM